MIRVQDISGNVIPGLFRDKNGLIVVNDKDAYQRYVTTKSFKERDAQKIDALQNELAELKSLVERLLNK